MNKKYISLALIVFFLTFGATSASAQSLITVTNEGDVRWSVLGTTDALRKEKPDLTLKKAPVPIANVAKISLVTKGTGVELSLESINGDKLQEVEVDSKDILEIEAREKPNVVNIVNTDNKLNIVQGSISAETDFPIQVNPEKRTLTLETESGERVLSVLPFDAVSTLTNANMIDIYPETKILLIESDDGELIYSIITQKEITLFKIQKIKYDVSANVSATNGRILNVDQPIWATLLNFIF